MPDPVNAADVMAAECGHPAWCVKIKGDTDGSHLKDALLAYGGGDPVVIMPDGTLRRLVPALRWSQWDPPSYTLTNPVVPE
jgi:hypothetical protein